MVEDEKNIVSLLLDEEDPVYFMNHMFIEYLGGGNYAKVYLGENIVGDHISRAAIKVYHPQYNSLKNDFGEWIFNENFPEEDLLYILKPLHIGHLKGTPHKELNGSLCMMMQYMDKGSLSDFIRKEKEEVVTLEVKLNLMIDAARGIAAAHKNGVVHGDIHPKNICVDSKCRYGELGAKISDLTFATKIKENEIDDNEIGNSITIGVRKSMMPSHYNCHDEIVDFKTDIWCFGASLLEVFTGRKRDGKFEHLYPNADYKELLMEEYSEEEIPLELKKQIVKCGKYRKGKRPESFDEIINKLVDIKENHLTFDPLEEIINEYTSKIREIGAEKGKYGVLGKRRIKEINAEKGKAYAKLKELGEASKRGDIESTVNMIREEDAFKTIDFVINTLVEKYGSGWNQSQLNSSEKNQRIYLQDAVKKWTELENKSMIIDTESGEIRRYEKLKDTNKGDKNG